MPSFDYLALSGTRKAVNLIRYRTKSIITRAERTRESIFESVLTKAAVYKTSYCLKHTTQPQRPDPQAETPEPPS